MFFICFLLLHQITNANKNSELKVCVVQSRAHYKFSLHFVTALLVFATCLWLMIMLSFIFATIMNYQSVIVTCSTSKWLLRANAAKNDMPQTLNHISHYLNSTLDKKPMVSLPHTPFRTNAPTFYFNRKNCTANPHRQWSSMLYISW